MGGTKLRALGHREFLAQATSLHNQGKCKQPYSANHTPNTCVQSTEEDTVDTGLVPDGRVS